MRFQFGDRVRGAVTASADFADEEGAIIYGRELTPEYLVHFACPAHESAWVLKSCLVVVSDQSQAMRMSISGIVAGSLAASLCLALPVSLVATEPTQLTFSAAAEPIAPDYHVHNEAAGDAGALYSFDLTVPPITGGVGMEFVRLAVDLREPDGDQQRVEPLLKSIPETATVDRAQEQTRWQDVHREAWLKAQSKRLCSAPWLRTNRNRRK